MSTSTPTLLTREQIELKIEYMRAKRILDICFTLLILPFLCVITVVVAILIRLDSQGPIFFRQRRIGLDGKEFFMLKFRTMYHLADDKIHRDAIARYMANLPINGSQDTANLQYKLTNDPRITRIGRFLRKTSIDELPQFFNVLRNEMSLVGPRPPVPYEVERYSARDMLRLSGKPGLTGPWQVYGRGRVPFAEMVEMDITYLKQQSLREDIKLMLLTLPVMIKGHGGA